MTKLRELISAVGRTRFYFLMTFLVLNALLAAGWQQWYIPKHKEVLDEQRALESERSRLQRDIVDLPKKYNEQKANIDRYEGLKAKGFFSPQDRIEARAHLDDIRTQAGLRGINYNIDAQETVAPPQSITMQDQIIRSKITVDMKGLTDLEMRDFILRMGNEFGGLLNTRSFATKTATKMDAASLRSISSGTPVDFVTGKVEFDWYSILPKPVDAASPEAQAFGGKAR